MDLLRRNRTRIEFERFVANHLDGLLQTGYLIASDLSEAEDLVQECLLRVAHRWPTVRSMDHPGAYARKILVNLALDGAGRRTRCRHELAAWDGESPEKRPDQKEDTIAIRTETSELLDALRLLSVRQRGVLVLRYFGDFSETEVAEMLGCSVGTVKSASFRGLARMREVLASDEGQLQKSLGKGE